MPTKPTSKLNRERHLAHKMPKNPSIEQRVQRHIEHSKHCACREIPENIKKLIEEKNQNN